ncbi:TRS65 (YGR166W) [Zygosaccharomyces parabailii]|nr:TRS65 (YGR166W) [Zygosaccharomyces parabailii]CDH12164.1 related to Trafficking protein particle complex II-specific subunit 65 [Zygosaccharomyces bailii ISA1307]
MECYIPLGKLADNAAVAEVKQSHDSRRFVVFDEDLSIYLRAGDTTRLHRFTVWINDAKVLQSQGVASFNKITDLDACWILKPGTTDSLFRSSVVMNNGYNNQIKFTVEYVEDPPISDAQKSSSEDEDSDILPSFEPVLPGEPPKQNANGILQSALSIMNVPPEQLKSITLQYPIYSLLNMRLRNSMLKNRHCIISSLDFQTSKASIQFSERYLPSSEPGGIRPELRLNFQELRYELVDRTARCPLDPITPFPVPFQAVAHDSYSISYQLPLVPDHNFSPHRVKITLKYVMPLGNHRLPITTTWETDVTLKKPAITNTPQPSSSLPTSRMYTLGSRINLLGSTTSFTNNKLNNVKFKFLDKNVNAYKGAQFTMTLQIVNSSTQPLDLVIYYNNRNPPPHSQISVPLPLDKQYQMYKRYRRTTEGVILLSNDYKVPLVGPHETYFVRLNFVGIISGYYSTLPGLKIVDLQRNELIEVGLGASIYIH